MERCLNADGKSRMGTGFGMMVESTSRDASQPPISHVLTGEAEADFEATPHQIGQTYIDCVIRAKELADTHRSRCNWRVGFLNF